MKIKCSQLQIAVWNCTPLIISATEMSDYGLFPFAHWITTIIAMALGTVFGLVYIGFAFFNVCGKPIETITGPLGLYIWNMLSCKKLYIKVNYNSFLVHQNINVWRTIVIAPALLSLSVDKNLNLTFNTH